MLSKKAIFAVCCIVPIAYYWFKYVKQGPVFITDKKLHGKTVLITGGNVGIGKATAVEFAKLGAKVVIASRNVAVSEETVQEIAAETKNNNVRFLHLDLEDFSSVRKFAEEFDKSEEHLDYLVNNAGVFGLRGMSDCGYNRVFTINYLGHFLLTNLLLEKMRKQSSSRPVRIINVSSDAYKMISTLDYDMMRRDSDGGVLDSFRQYGNSKAAINLITGEFDRRLADYQVTAVSLTPGIVRTDIETNMPGYFVTINRLLMSPFMRSPFYGAQTILYCALDEEVVKYSGEYFKDCQRDELWSHAKDEGMAGKLWHESLKITGLASGLQAKFKPLAKLTGAGMRNAQPGKLKVTTGP